MHTDPSPDSRGESSHMWRGPLVRSVVVAVTVVVAYFTLPFTAAVGAGSTAVLAGGLLVVAALLVLQIRAIQMSRHPRAKGVETVAMISPLFFVVFATTYHVMAHLDPAAWSEPLTRLDALYFTITVFATVGFGDIHALSQTARGIVTVQMVANLALIGLVTKVIVHAVQVGLARRATEVDGAG
jgi:voltage-gated potassium channel